MIEIASFQHMVDYTLPSMTQRVTYFLDSFNTNNVDLLTCIQIKKSSKGADGKANNLDAFTIDAGDPIKKTISGLFLKNSKKE